ncbi:hypothetical protein AB0I68_30285 [Streptomyces sp. NPDC050448]|uniref:hypothetical protein n=1 Tax=Streptomyces sp. NPDC050448 TaxID=3155404 RepID=UPI0034415C6D
MTGAGGLPRVVVRIRLDDVLGVESCEHLMSVARVVREHGGQRHPEAGSIRRFFVEPSPGE